MGKYRKYDMWVDEKPRWKVHPIWRGIGCLLLILLPIVSYAAAVLIVDANRTNGYIPIPRELTGPPQYPYLFANLIVTLLVMFFAFALLSTFYALLYRIIGPPRYGPLDSPPIKKKKVKRKKKESEKRILY